MITSEMITNDALKGILEVIVVGIIVSLLVKFNYYRTSNVVNLISFLTIILFVSKVFVFLWLFLIDFY